MTSSFIERWQTWWLKPCSPHLLAIFRIGFGAFLFIEALTYLPFVPVMFSTKGLVISLSVPVPPPIVAWIIALLYVAATMGLMIGYRMRVAIMTLLVLFLYYWQLSFYLFPSSYHRLFFFILIILIFSGADKTFSIRMLRERGSLSAWEPISILPQRILAVHMTAVYAVVGLQKWWLPMWQSGDVLYYSFMTRWGSPLARWFVRLGFTQGFYEVLTWGTKIFETVLPVALWIPRVRWAAFFGGLVFHLCIALFLEIWWFLVLVPAYIVFLEPDRVYDFLRRHFPRFVR